MKKVLIFCLVSLVSLATQAQSALVGKSAPKFSLEDQFDRKTEVNFAAKKPTFLLFSDRDRESAKQADKWGTELVSEYGNDIKVIVVAVTGKGAKLAKNRVQNAFKNSDPILFDWDGDVANMYHYPENAALVVYVNKEGIVEAVQTGVYTDDKYNKLTEKLDETE